MAGGAAPSPAPPRGPAGPFGAEVPLGPPWHWVVPASWRAVDLVSDLHLSEAMPRTFAAFAAHLEGTDADAVLILGDLFELWVGDDARDEPFARRCTALLAAAAQRRAVAVMAGNRDFLMGAELMQACGALALPDPTLLEACGHRLLLTHGDALCMADRDYQAFRRTVRSDAFRQDFLARPLAERLRFAAEVREASEARRRLDGDLGLDIDRDAALHGLHATAAEALVHGHTHRPGSDELASGHRRWVLSDWDLDGGDRAGVLRLDAAGLRRVLPSAA